MMVGMTDLTFACPVCRTEMQPTWFKEMRAHGGDVVRRLPMDRRCPNRCDQTTPVDDYNAAIIRLDQERNAQQ